MNIKIILEGKLKESFYKAGFCEYNKRLLNKVQLVEVDSIFDYLKKSSSSFVYTLEIEGKQLSSSDFANNLKEVENDGHYNEILFLIGGAEGLDSRVRKLSDFKLSLSKMTFLHQESVLILIEQIYRAYKILNNEPYHK